MRRLRMSGVALILLATGCLTEAQLLALRTCESKGDYSAVSDSGKYRGAYQFSHKTWRTVGGSGDPAQASPEEQDMRARLLHLRDGSGQWPVCGRRI